MNARTSADTPPKPASASGKVVELQGHKNIPTSQPDGGSEPGPRRGAKASVTVPDGLVEEVERQLASRVVNLISLARKSGEAVAGYEKVKSWLDREEARVLIQATDGSARGKSKLSTPYKGDYIGWLTADELGLAFGRQTVIHGALGSGGLGQRDVARRWQLGINKHSRYAHSGFTLLSAPVGE